MSLPVPRLDTVDFEALVNEARGLIPRYAPHWTDHNLHDPGITLIELLAWIADQEIFRIGFVGDRYRRAFAALLGERPHRAAPAHGTIWPPAGPNSARLPAQPLKAGQRITNVEQPDLPFMLERDVFLSDAKLLDPRAIEGGKRVVLRGLAGREGVHYSATSGASGNPTEIEFPFDRPLVSNSGASQLVSVGFAVDSVIGEANGSAKAWGPIAFEYSVNGGEFERSPVAFDGTLALARSGVVLIAIPGRPGRSSTLRLRLDRGFFPIPPRLRRAAINVLPVVQLEEIGEGELARSNGLPDQTYELDFSVVPETPEPGEATGLPIRPLKIQVNGTDWSQVDDLTNSAPDDPHYVIDERRGRIRFGNGVNGAIPARNAQIERLPHHATKGVAGNLGSRRKWRIGGLPAEFTNIDPIAGGSDVANVDELLAAARTRAITREALLTNEELTGAAEALPGFAVKRAEICLRHDPFVPDATIRGTRTLVVVPARDPATPPPGGVPQAYLDAVLKALAPRRLIGERLSVAGPEYVRVNVELRVLIAAGTDGSELSEKMEAAIRSRLTDLARDPDIAPWPLGRSVTCREIKALAAKIPEVSVVRECRIARTGEAHGIDDIVIGPTAIAIAADVNVAVEPETLGSA